MADIVRDRVLAALDAKRKEVVAINGQLASLTSDRERLQRRIEELEFFLEGTGPGDTEAAP